MKTKILNFRHRNTGIMMLIFAICILTSVGQTQVTYQMTYGSSQNEEARSVISTSSGYLFGGSTNSFGAGSIDYYLIGTDTCGSVTLSKTIGGTAAESCYDVIRSFGGRNVLYGRTNSFGVADVESYLVELNSGNSNVKTSWVVGDTLKEEGQAIVEARDSSGFVGTGFTNSYGAGNYDIYVIKHRYNGTIAWTKVIGGNNLDKAYDIQTTSDGGYIVVGETKSFGQGKSDVYLLKLNASGNISWTKTYGTSGNDVGYSVKQILGGGYAIAGYTELHDSIPFGKNIYVINTDGSGNLNWSGSYGGSDNDEGRSIVQLADSSFAICGITNSFGAGNDDAYLIKTNLNGTLSWGMTYGGDSIDRCFCLLNTADNGFLLTGQTYSFGNGKSDVYAIKTDNNGFSGCNEDSGAVYYEVLDSISAGGSLTSGGIVNTGGILNSPTTLTDTLCNSCYEFRTPSTGLIPNELNLRVYPNPTATEINIQVNGNLQQDASIEICNVNGILVFSSNLSSNFIQIPVIKYTSGIYFIKIINGDETINTKVMIE